MAFWSGHGGTLAGARLAGWLVRKKGGRLEWSADLAEGTARTGTATVRLDAFDGRLVLAHTTITSTPAGRLTGKGGTLTREVP